MQRHVPQAIVLDLMMPRLNASGFVERMRLNPRFAAIPILIVTASYAAHEAAERLGAQACLTKPFELDELVDQVGRMLAEPPPRRRPRARPVTPIPLRPFVRRRSLSRPIRAGQGYDASPCTGLRVARASR